MSPLPNCGSGSSRLCLRSSRADARSSRGVGIYNDSFWTVTELDSHWSTDDWQRHMELKFERFDWLIERSIGLATSINDDNGVPAHLLGQVKVPAPGPPIASVPVWAGRPRRLRHSLELRNSFAICRGCEMQCAYAPTMGCNASGADANWQLHGLNEVRSMRDDPPYNDR